ncbi:MAG: extracellular solute-binding protein [Pseudomonadota bacterium]
MALAVALLGTAAAETPTHGIAAHGMPALAPGFDSLPYVNPEAPKGGEVVFGEFGSFDSLNPFVLRGTAPWALATHTHESLLSRSYAEPFTLYANLAESVVRHEDGLGVSFTLRAEAQFSDGSPVTVEDVLWSFRILGEEGHPRYRPSWDAIETIEQTGPRSLAIRFAEPNRELPLILGLRPVLQKRQFEGRALDAIATEPLIGTGPYVVDSMELGRSITFRRNPTWWGRDLALHRGLNNFETVRYDYFRSGDALWQAVAAGEIDFYADGDPVRWQDGYGFAAATDGRLTRTEIPHNRPSGMRGFVFNTRRPPLDDRRLREALGLAFDWSWINGRLYGGGYRRITSYFSGSDLAFDGPASSEERALLAPFAPSEAVLEGAAWPESDGSGRDRRLLRRAARLLDEAGFEVTDGVRRGPNGAPLSFGVLVSATEHETLAGLWAEGLKPLGIDLVIRRVDAAQFAERRRSYDYDITVHRWPLSLSPGTEQRFYFGSEGRTREGTRNYAGIEDPAVDAAIDGLLTAPDEAAFRTAARTLDRLLTTGLYVVPWGVLPTDRVVHDADLRHPAFEDGKRSLYGWFGWWSGPGIWWREEE